MREGTPESGVVRHSHCALVWSQSNERPWPTWLVTLADIHAFSQLSTVWVHKCYCGRAGWQPSWPRASVGNSRCVNVSSTTVDSKWHVVSLVKVKLSSCIYNLACGCTIADKCISVITLYSWCNWSKNRCACILDFCVTEFYILWKKLHLWNFCETL